jgi:hypothetical protein
VGRWLERNIVWFGLGLVAVGILVSVAYLWWIAA